MYEYEEQLFGVDMRHKPPLPQMLTAEGWGSSHGRLAYSQMNRSQECNYSEYAINSLGFMPKNYVIVNQNEVKFNKDTALKVGHNRVAIPVKEFARQKRLTLKEQWELMNPQWIGTFFGFCGEEPYRNRRPSLEQAMSDAMECKKFDEFMQQFWSAKYGHKKAVDRLERRAKDLDSRADAYYSRYRALDIKITSIESDMNRGQYEKYHLQGYNVHEYLRSLKAEKNEAYMMYWENSRKSRRIKEYINSITY